MAPYDDRTWRHDHGLPFAGPSNPNLEGERKPLNQLRQLLEADVLGRGLAYTVGGSLPLSPFYPTWQWSEEDEEKPGGSETDVSRNPVLLGPDAESEDDSDPEPSDPDGYHDAVWDFEAEGLSLPVRTKLPPTGRQQWKFPWEKADDARQMRKLRRAAGQKSPPRPAADVAVAEPLNNSGFTTSNEAFAAAFEGFQGPADPHPGKNLVFPGNNLVFPGLQQPWVTLAAVDSNTVREMTAFVASSSLEKAPASTAKKSTKKAKGKAGKFKPMPPPQPTEFSREAYSQNMDQTDVADWSTENFVTLRWDARRDNDNRPTPQRLCKLDFPSREQTANNIRSLLLDMDPTEFGYQLAPEYFSTTFNPNDFGIIDLVEQALLPTWSSAEETHAKRPPGRSIEAFLWQLRVHCSTQVRNSDKRHEGMINLIKEKDLEDTTWPGQFGRLVVTLPFKAFTGGKLTIHPPNVPIPNQEPIVYDTWGTGPAPGQPPVINWAAYHLGCNPTVSPVRSGYRISLVYNLFRVQGMSQMGSLPTTSRILDLTKLPVYQYLKALLSDEMAWDKKGGYIGFMMTHAYPHNTKQGHDIGFIPENSLRGLDFQMYQICREFFARDNDGAGPGVPLDIQFRPVMRWPGRYFKGAKKNTMELLLEDGIERIKAKREKKRQQQQQTQTQQPRVQTETGDVQAEGATTSSSSAGTKGKEKESAQQRKENLKPERRTGQSQGQQAHFKPQAESASDGVVAALRKAQEDFDKGRMKLSSAQTARAHEPKGKGKEKAPLATTNGQDVHFSTPSQRIPATFQDKLPQPTKPHQIQQPQPEAPKKIRAEAPNEVQELQYPTPVIGKNFSRAGLLPTRQFTGDEKSMETFMKWWAAGGKDKDSGEGYYIDFEDVHWLNGWGHEEVSLVATQLDDNGATPRMLRTALAMIVKIPPGGINASRKNKRLWPAMYQEGYVMESIEEEDETMEDQ